MNKRLTRSRDKKLFGVCAGIGEYFDIDPTVIRVLWVCVTIFSTLFPGILLYFILAAIIPSDSM